MHGDTSIDSRMADCQGLYMNIATVFQNMASQIKKELQNAKGMSDGTITMVDVEDMLATLENQINNSLSQITNQRVIIELGRNYEKY